MVKNPLYQPMLNFKKDVRGPLEIEAGVARQKVTLVTASGSLVSYVFVLSKQKEPPFEDCWMTDMVMRLGEEEAGNQKVAGTYPAMGAGS